MSILAPKGIRKGLPPLIAPHHLAGRMSKWTPEHIRHARVAWSAEQGRKGYSSYEVAASLGISQPRAYLTMTAGGWDTWADKRAQHHGAQA